MNSLNLQSPQASLDLPPMQPECDLDRGRGSAANAPEDDLDAARGIVIAVALSAVMWLIVLATVTFF